MTLDRRRYISHAAVLVIAAPTIAFLGATLGRTTPAANTTQTVVAGAYDVPLPPDYAETLALLDAAAQAAAPTAAAPPALFTKHAVAEGETLSGIAEQHGVSVDHLIWNNPELSGDPNLLQVGDELIVPAEAGVVYDVRLGDTIYGIAATYGVDPAAIVGYAPNNLTTPDMILEGMVLLLPGGVPPTPVYTVEEAGAGDNPVAGDVPAAVVRSGPVEVSAGFIWPVVGAMWGGFGPRWGSFHKGIDIGAAYGTAVSAAASGQVVLATSGGGYGNYVIVRHGDGTETLYAHLSSIYVGLGQYVGQGEVVGAVGCTGRCSGNHLHFEVYAGGVPVNPLAYLP